MKKVLVRKSLAYIKACASPSRHLTARDFCRRPACVATRGPRALMDGADAGWKFRALPCGVYLCRHSGKHARGQQPPTWATVRSGRRSISQDTPATLGAAKAVYGGACWSPAGPRPCPIPSTAAGARGGVQSSALHCTARGPCCPWLASQRRRSATGLQRCRRPVQEQRPPPLCWSGSQPPFSRQGSPAPARTFFPPRGARARRSPRHRGGQSLALPSRGSHRLRGPAVKLSRRLLLRMAAYPGQSPAVRHGSFHGSLRSASTQEQPEASNGTSLQKCAGADTRRRFPS